MGIFGLILLCERVKGIINDCISRQFAAYKEVSNYNTWKKNASSNFIGQIPDVVS